MTESEVASLLAALNSGAMSLDDVADIFRRRNWPDIRSPVPQSYKDLAAVTIQDPDPEIPGSFDDVVAAYDRGEITREQYRTLAEAAADSIRAEYDAAESGDEPGAHE